jgi:hypothetical protein
MLKSIPPTPPTCSLACVCKSGPRFQAGSRQLDRGQLLWTRKESALRFACRLPLALPGAVARHLLGLLDLRDIAHVAESSKWLQPAARETASLCASRTSLPCRRILFPSFARASATNTCCKIRSPRLPATSKPSRPSCRKRPVVSACAASSATARPTIRLVPISSTKQEPA